MQDTPKRKNRRRPTSTDEARRSSAPAVQARKSGALGPRAARTRQKLIDTSTRLFREQGFLGTSVSDIAREAGVSMATFYVYFADRTDVVAELLEEVVGDVMSRGVGHWDPRSGRIGLSRVVAPYVEGFAEHAEFFRVWQSVIQVDAGLRERYIAYNRRYQERFARFLKEGIELGLVRSDLNPTGMAKAMTLMMERYCYDVFVLAPPAEPVGIAETANLLTMLWADAIDLSESQRRPRAN